MNLYLVSMSHLFSRVVNAVTQQKRLASCASLSVTGGLRGAEAAKRYS